MLNQLSYGATIPDDLLLGHIAWWTVLDPKIGHDDLLKLATDHHLSPSIIPKPPRLGDAFKRACRYSERTGLPIPGSPHLANFMIRKVTQNTEEVERHLVLEIVDKAGLRLEYHTAAAMTFTRKDSKLKIKALSLDPELNNLVRETLSRFTDRFDEASNTIDPQVLRWMVRAQLDLMSGVPVRRQGSVYFVPIAHKDMTEHMAAFFDAMPGESSFHFLPLVDTTKQREMVKAAWEEEVHELAQGLIADMTKAKDSGRKLTDKSWELYKRRYNDIQARASEYKALVEMEMTKAEIEVAAVSQHLTDFLTSDIIIT